MAQGTSSHQSQAFIYQGSHQNILTEVKPFYVPERSLPSHNVYFYAYAITIKNLSDTPCRLMRRCWFVNSGNGKKEKIEGEGVLGNQPLIEPGEQFKYASFCPLQSPYGNMRGRYQMWNQKKGLFWVRVPVFFFRPPPVITGPFSSHSPTH